MFQSSGEKMYKKKLPGIALISAMAAMLSAPAQSLEVTATEDANDLIGALTGSGIVITGVTVLGHEQTVDFGLVGVLAPIVSSGVFTNFSGTYGIGGGVILSTGGVETISYAGAPIFPGYGDSDNTVTSNSWAYGGTFPVVVNPDEPTPGLPATAAQEILLDAITGSSDHYDVTELVVTFDMQPGNGRVALDVVFGSEEFPEFAGSLYLDGFGLFLNGVNIARVNGLPINIGHPAMAAIPGTELDGVLAPDGAALLTLSGAVNPTGNTLRFIVADTYDGVYDTVVYLSGLRGLPPAPDQDADGIADSLDNCTLVANPSQCDSDSDGYGNHCDGDFNNNGFTNGQDYVLFRAQVGKPSVAPAYNQADMNCNGFVNTQDYILLRGRLGVPSGPSGLHPLLP
jgi:hypothetical protein